MANTHTALQALRHLQQKSHENIQTFYEILLDLAEQAFLNDAINEQGNQDQLLTIFIDGLTDVRIRRHVIRKRPRNVGEALSHAIDEHDMLNEIDTRASSSDKKVSDKHTPHHGYINQTRTQQATPQQYPHHQEAEDSINQQTLPPASTALGQVSMPHHITIDSKGMCTRTLTITISTLTMACHSPGLLPHIGAQPAITGKEHQHPALTTTTVSKHATHTHQTRGNLIRIILNVV